MKAQIHSVVSDLNFAVINLSPVALGTEPRVLSKLSKPSTIALDLSYRILCSASPRLYFLFSAMLESIKTYDQNHWTLKYVLRALPLLLGFAYISEHISTFFFF